MERLPRARTSIPRIALRALVTWVILAVLLTFTGSMGSVELTLALVVAIAVGVLWSYLPRR